MNVIFMTTRVALLVPDDLVNHPDHLSLIEDGIAPVEEYAHSPLEVLETIHAWTISPVREVDEEDDIRELLEGWAGGRT